MIDWVEREGRRIFNQPGRPDGVSVRKNGSAFLVTLAFGPEVRQMIVKRHEPTPIESTAEEACRFHRRVRSQRAFLASHTPDYLGFDPVTDYVAMQCLAGPTLLDTLRCELREPGSSRFQVPELLSQSAKLLAEFHRIEPATVGRAATCRSHRSFAAGLRQMLDERSLKLLPQATTDKIREHLRALPKEFLDRTTCRIIVADSQPKNMIVQSSGNVAHIDLQYLFAPPMLNVGSFLVGLFRLQLRYFRSRPIGQLMRWRRAFVTEYLHAATEADPVGLRFFYIFTLIVAFREQLEKRRLMGRLLVPRYVAHFESILADELFAAPSPAPFQS